MTYGEGKVTWRVEIDGPKVKLMTFTGPEITADCIIGFLPPAQARELARILTASAERCETWEGLPGMPKANVAILLPHVRFDLDGELQT